MTGWRLTTIVSCAGPGAARGALDAAVELDLQYGGWRALADVPPIYAERTRKTNSPRMAARLNVQDSDGTLVVTLSTLYAAGRAGSSAAYVDEAIDRQRKPSLNICLPAGGRSQMPEAVAKEVRAWLREERIHILHVSGSNEDDEPGIQEATRDVLVWIFEDEIDIAQRSVPL